MTESNDDELIQRLEQLGALEPTAQATHRALEKARIALARTNPDRRTVMLRRLIAASLFFAILVGLLVWVMPTSAPASAGFGEIQAAMKSSRSVTCRQTIKRGDEPGETTRMLILSSGIFRYEDSDGSYSIMDPAKSRGLRVSPQKRQATTFQNWNIPQVNFYDLLRNLPSDATARPLPGKKLDGKDVLGFVVKIQTHDVTVWADARTRLPVRIEARETDAQGMAVEAIVDEFTFDKELDEKLFSLDPPAGYKVQTMGTPELPVAAAAPQLKDLVVTPGVGIGPVKFRMTREEVEKLLGKPDGIQEVGKTGYVNMSYGSRGFFLGVSKTLGVVTISCVTQQSMAVRVRDFTGKTDKGIALGASSTAIIKAYGEPTSKELDEGTTHMSYGSLHTQFTLLGDKLVQILLTMPRPAKP